MLSVILGVFFIFPCYCFAFSCSMKHIGLEGLSYQFEVSAVKTAVSCNQ